MKSLEANWTAKTIAGISILCSRLNPGSMEVMEHSTYSVTACCNFMVGKEEGVRLQLDRQVGQIYSFFPSSFICYLKIMISPIAKRCQLLLAFQAPYSPLKKVSTLVSFLCVVILGLEETITIWKSRNSSGHFLFISN